MHMQRRSSSYSYIYIAVSASATSWGRTRRWRGRGSRSGLWHSKSWLGLFQEGALEWYMCWPVADACWCRSWRRVAPGEVGHEWWHLCQPILVPWRYATVSLHHVSGPMVELSYIISTTKKEEDLFEIAWDSWVQTWAVAKELDVDGA